MAFPKSGKTNPQRGKLQPEERQVFTLKPYRRHARLASQTQIRPMAAVAIGQIKPHPRNARTHSKKQIRQIADSIRAVGFAAPVLIDEDGVLLAGHGRLEAARLLGLKTIPAIVIDGLTEARKRGLLLADNLSLSQIKSVRIDGAVRQARVDLRCARRTE
jgi:hypothetical protein